MVSSSSASTPHKRLISNISSWKESQQQKQHQEQLGFLQTPSTEQVNMLEILFDLFLCCQPKNPAELSVIRIRVFEDFQKTVLRYQNPRRNLWVSVPCE